MVQILLTLEVLFTQDSKVEDLFCGACSGSEPSLFFSNYFFSLGFQPIQDDFQHDFARMTDEADSFVALAELQCALFRECNNQRLSPWGRPFSCFPDSVTDFESLLVKLKIHVHMLKKYYDRFFSFYFLFFFFFFFAKRLLFPF